MFGLAFAAFAVFVILALVLGALAVVRWARDMGELLAGLFSGLHWHPEGWTRQGILRRYEPPKS